MKSLVATRPFDRTALVALRLVAIEVGFARAVLRTSFVVALTVAVLSGCGGGDESRGAEGSQAAVRAKALAGAHDPAAPLRYVRLEAVSEVNGNRWTSLAEFQLLDAGGAPLPRTGWSATANSQETAGENAPASAAIDGDANTFWHSQWQGAAPGLPHSLTIDLGTPRAIGGFKYLPRQNGENGRIAGWRFHTSADGVAWTLAAEGVFAPGGAEATVMLADAAANNRPPSIASLSNRTDGVGQPVAMALAAVDPDGDTVTYVSAGLPGGLSLDARSGSITGQPIAPGRFEVIVQAHDGRGGSTSASFIWTITVGGGALSARYVRLEALTEANGKAWTSVAEFNLLDANAAVLPRTGWSAVADSQETAGEYTPASAAIDGDPNTFWHTRWQGPGLPHALTVDLGASRAIGGFRYLPRQGGENGRIGAWRFSASSDGAVWKVVAEAVFPRTEVEQRVMFGGAAATNRAPALAAVPALDGVVGRNVSVALVGTDADGDPLTFTARGLPTGLTLDAASGAISGVPMVAAAHTVTIELGDGRGGVASTAFEWTIASASADPGARYVRLEALSEVNGRPWTSIAEFNVLDVNGMLVSRAGWTASADSQELNGDYAPAGNAIDGGAGSIWHSQWQAAAPAPPHALTVDLGATRAVGGFRYLPRQDGPNGRIAAWRFHTSPDGSRWTQFAQGSFADSASEQGYFAAGGSSSTPMNSASRAARIAAFGSGPLVAGPPWQAGAAVQPDDVRRLASGQHLLYTGAGVTGGVAPVLGTTATDGRPVTDGTATAYVNGRVVGAAPGGAPIVGSAPSPAAAGLTPVVFALGDHVAPRYAVARGCRSISTGTSFVGHFCFANGPAAGSGNATAFAAGPYGAGLSPNYVYHSNGWEEEFVVTDRYFGLVFANSRSPVNVEIDGVQLQAAPAVSTGAEGWTLTLDFKGVSKRRTVRVVSAAGSIGPTLRGVALTAAGSVEAGSVPKDQVLILGDSINASVTPSSEAGAQLLSYWVQRYLGFDGAINMAVGGSGYVSQNANTFNVGNVLANPVNQALIAGYAPGVTHVIFGAGFNDRFRPVAEVQTAALASWKALRALLPNARISVTDGWSGSSGPDAAALNLAAALASAHAQWGDANSRLIRSVGSSTGTAYVSGTGHAGIPVVAGNSSVYTSTDGVHPSPAGARHIARRLADDIASAWAGAY